MQRVRRARVCPPRFVARARVVHGLLASFRMDIRVRFPGGKRVDARVGAHCVRTDQSPEHGGQGFAPEPFDLFLASLASCAGLYVLTFCQARQLPTEGIWLEQHQEFDPTSHALTQVTLTVHLPVTFPDKYRDDVQHAADGSKLVKMLAAPPKVVVHTETDDFGARVSWVA